MNAPFDAVAMAEAVQLARKGWYTTAPNPRVGCVIARDGEIIGRGWHRRAGEAHAEINALASVGDKARGATVYVTLEPCNHRGRTGPCAEALVQAGIAELVYGMRDPHTVAVGGLETLELAGVRVRGPCLEPACRALNPGFIKRCETGLPRVRLKMAMSLDGRTAMASGESFWITGADARADVQRLRAESDAVVTGIDTVLVDDPQLNVRAGQSGLLPADVDSRQPLRVVIDSQGRLPEAAKLLHQPGRTLVFTAGVERRIAGAELVVLPAAPAATELEPRRVNLRAVVEALAQRDCNEVLVEAGATLAGAFLSAGLVDELIVYMAPKLLGSAARPLLTLPLQQMTEALDLEIGEIIAVGSDWRISARPRGN